jgi:L-iditol 2-dehydrogenase
MKAIALTGIRKMELQQIPDPVIQNENEVMIRMNSVGICGSDVHYYSSGKIGEQQVVFPWIVGHEGAGVVESIGKSVTSVQPGDRIAIDPAMPCGNCDQCLAGRHHTCRNLKFLACPGQAAGCLSEFIILPESSCFPLSDRLTFDQAVISEPLAVGVYAVKKAANIKNSTIGVLGTGPIGLSVIMAAKVAGAANIYATDKLDNRLAIAKRAGADWTGNPLNQDIIKDIKKIEPQELDVIFECCGSQEAFDQALHLLKPGGKLMIIGIPQFDRFSFLVDLGRRKEVCLQNVRRQVDCVDSALDLIETGRTPVEIMITHHFNLSETQDAFELASNYSDGIIKGIVNISY